MAGLDLKAVYDDAAEGRVGHDPQIDGTDPHLIGLQAVAAAVRSEVPTAEGVADLIHRVETLDGWLNWDEIHLISRALTACDEAHPEPPKWDKRERHEAVPPDVGESDRDESVKRIQTYLITRSRFTPDDLDVVHDINMGSSGHVQLLASDLKIVIHTSTPTELKRSAT